VFLFRRIAARSQGQKGGRRGEVNSDTLWENQNTTAPGGGGEKKLIRLTKGNM